MSASVNDQKIEAAGHPVKRKNPATLWLFVLVVVAGLTASPVLADVPITRQVTLELSRQGEPYRAPVSYMVRCYGYTFDPGLDPLLPPGSYTPEEVYRFQAECPAFGCKTVLDTYLNYRHIDTCDLEVQAQGQQYLVENFGSWPFGECERAGAGEAGVSEACTLVADIPDLPAVEDPLASRGVLTTGLPLSVAFLLALLLSWLIEVPVVWLLARY